MPPIVIQLIAAVVGELFRQILLNLPALEAGIRQVETPTATDAPAIPMLSRDLDGELQAFIQTGEAPAP